MSELPERAIKTGAGIGGELTVCNYCNRSYDSCRCHEVYNLALDRCTPVLTKYKTKVKELEAENAGKWISVTEKIPSEYCLVWCDENRFQESGVYVSMPPHFDPVDKGCRGVEWRSLRILLNVTHWMPLPNNPRG
jgi:hypothetical protein